MTSSTWDDLCRTVDDWGKKASRKVEQLTDTAALRLRLAAKRSELEEKYTQLGRLTFEHGQNDEQGEINACVASIRALREEIERLEAECQADA